MSNKYKKYYGKIKKNQIFFEGQIKRLETITNVEEKLAKARELANFATFHNCGYFVSSVLETIFTDYAKTIDIDNYNVQFKPNSFLHVMTVGYKTGGHTRVVERWIKNAPGNQTHSVVFTEKSDDFGLTLNENVKEKNGQIFYLDQFKDIKSKSLELRKLALNYQYVILHIHMDDPTALVAFGTEKFTRPIALYNHASHLFWLGKSVADIVLDIVSNDKITKEKRQINKAFTLGIPVKNVKFAKSDKSELRKKLNLPLDKKIIIASGDKKKFIPICDDDFVKVVSEILDEGTYCYVIGPSIKEKYWKNANLKSNKHIIPLGYINFEEGYLDYIAAADFCLDSYPISGGTAIIDAISSNIPVLSLKAVLSQTNFFIETSGYCDTKDELVQKAKKILSDQEFANALLQEEQNSLITFQSNSAWNIKVDEILKLLPQKHAVKDLSEEKIYKEIDDVAVLDNVITNDNFISGEKTFKRVIIAFKYILYKHLLRNKRKTEKYEMQYFLS